MPRRQTVAILGLALVIAAAPFVPRGHHRDGRITPSGGVANRPANTSDNGSALGALSADQRAEIDRVIREGLAQPAARATSPVAMTAREIRCASFEQLTYCLHLGWVDGTQSQVQARFAAAAQASYDARRVSAKASLPESTGDLDPLAQLSQISRLNPQARAQAERAELTEAARSIAKVWVLRHEIQGVPYPAGFLARHPEAVTLSHANRTVATSARSASPAATGSASASPSASATAKTSADYPQADKILDRDQVAEQTRTYWCGPTTMQMIGWGWWDVKRSQDKWARRLGTTSSGSDISVMAATVNRYTGWDGKKYAGPYVVLDIGKWRYKQWYLLLQRHIHDYHAPLVMHPILLKKYFPYLDDDASGHYQVGRGYSSRGDKPDLVGYFEPWNQQRFDPSEPYINRVQWQHAYLSFRANKAHPYHNIGV